MRSYDYCFLEALGLFSNKNINEKLSGELPINFFGEDKNYDDKNRIMRTLYMRS